MTHSIEREQLVAASLPQVFEFFARARNLEELTPPWLRFSVLTPEPIEMRPGTLVEYRRRRVERLFPRADAYARR